MKIPYTDYIRSSCELAGQSIFLGLWKATGEYPCGGCGYKTCPTRKELEFKNTPKPIPGKHFETNAQIASRLGVSKRQVAKMRRDGRLPA
jgi:hypothetical protein